MNRTSIFLFFDDMLKGKLEAFQFIWSSIQENTGGVREPQSDNAIIANIRDQHIINFCLYEY